MKRKAQIDILDLPLDDDTTLIEESDRTISEEPPPEEFPSEKKKKRHGLSEKKMMLIISFAALTIIIMVSIGYFAVFQHGTKKQVHSVQQKTASVPTVNMAVIEDFHIDVKDDKGMTRLLTCGLFFETASKEEVGLLEAKIEIRKIIYDSFRKRKAGDLMNSDEKKAIKKEIANGVNALMGGEIVKAVYLTKFLLL